MASEDVEDDGRAVDDRDAEPLLERALLTGAELVVGGDYVGVELARELLELLELAGPKVAVRMRVLALLDQLADDRDAGRAQQLAQLVELLGGVLARGDAQRALARPAFVGARS